MTRLHLFVTRFFLLVFAINLPVAAKISSLPTDTVATPPAAPQKKDAPRAGSIKKDHTILVYFAGVNNLGAYIPISLMQMQAVAGNNKMNIVAEVDKHDTNKWLYKSYAQWAKEIGYPPLNIVDSPTKRPSKDDKNIVRLEAGKDKIFCHWSAQKNLANASGTRTALYSFLEWGITNFPAKHYSLFIWNHGSGALEPPPSQWNYDPEVINPSEWPPTERRGIAFHDIKRTYLSGAYLAEVLGKAQQNLLGGKKFDLLCLDACLMAMVESCVEFAPHADYLVASQEVGWGSGWNYAESFRPLLTKEMSPRELAQHLVSTYRQEMQGEFVPAPYKSSHQVLDYTLSAVDLSKTERLADTISELSGTLIKRLKSGDTGLRDHIKNIRTNKTYSTSFYDNSYIDLHQFCQSLRSKISDSDELFSLCSAVENSIAIATIRNTKNILTLPHVRGLSIYFPPRRKFHTYPSMCRFAKEYLWDDFLDVYRTSF